MSDHDLESKTKEQLLDLAKEHDIRVTGSLLKRELLALLRQSKKVKKNKPLPATRKTRASARSASEPLEKSRKKSLKTRGKILAPKKVAPVPDAVSYPPHAVTDDMAQESKFILGRPQIQDEAQHDAVQELPVHYGHSKLILMVRDPHWAYSYWEIRQDTIDAGLGALARPHHEIRWVLRVHTLPSNTASKPSFFDIDVQPHVRNWYLQLTPGASFYAEIGLMDRQNNFYRLAVSNKITMPLDRPSDIIDDRWMTTDEQFQKLYTLAGGGRLGSGSEAARKERQLEFGVSSGSFVSSLFSPPPAERRRKFWFWVDAELIVYGGTEPGAKATLCGQRIELRPDGTFTTRFALPDGIQNIPVTAESADGLEIRTIIPVVSRNTERPEPIVKQEEA